MPLQQVQSALTQSGRTLRQHWQHGVTVLVVVALILLGGWTFLTIVQSHSRQIKQGLRFQLSQTALQIEQNHRQMLENARSFARAERFTLRERWSREDPRLLRPLKQFFSTYQDRLLQIRIDAADGQWLTIQRSRSNYYSTEQGMKLTNQTPLDAIESSRIDEGVLDYTYPVRSPDGDIRYSFNLRISLEKLFEKSLRPVFGGLKTNSWAMDSDLALLYQLSMGPMTSEPPTFDAQNAKRLRDDIAGGFMGDFDHSIALEGKRTSAFTTYYPIKLSDHSFVIGFTAPRSSLFGNLQRTSLILSGIFAVLLLLTIRIFTSILRQRSQAQQAMRESRQTLRTLINASDDPQFLKDVDGRYLVANRAHEPIFGINAREMIGRTDFDWMSKEDAQRCWESDQLALQQGKVEVEEQVGERWYHVVKHRVDDPDGRVIGIAAIIRDTTERKQLEQSLREAQTSLEHRVAKRTAQLTTANRALTEEIATRRQIQKRLQIINRLYENGADGIAITDANAVIQEVNPAFTEITGYPPEAVIGQKTNILKSDRHDADFYRQMWHELLHTGYWEGEIWNRRRDGAIYPEWLRISAIQDEDQHTTHYVSMHHDISDRKSQEEKIRHLALHDALTGLPNRTLLMDRITGAIHRADRSRGRLALMALDIDNFKTINDSLGHPAGDQVLQEVAERLLHCVRTQDTVSRMGGDEFIILMDAVEREHVAQATAERILDTFKTPFSLHGTDLHITPSVGITFYPDHAGNSEELIKNADMAMYLAKESGKACFRVFSNEMYQRVLERIGLEQALRKAVENKAFDVHYQPIIDSRRQCIIGLEALARWPQGVDAPVPPDRFIPVAEEIGLIDAISQQIFERAFGQLSQWQDQFQRPLKLAINISARQLYHDHLPRLLQNLCDRHRLSNSLIELEITETAIMENMERTIPLLQQLSTAGYHLSIDDFGTGYSSLNYLKRFPINTLKIDRSFVNDLPEDHDDASIVEAVLSMGDNLGLAVLAEGVETEEQHRFLTERGCYLLQGYLFSRPLPAEQITEMLQHGPFAIN